MFIYPKALRIESTKAQLLLNIVPTKMEVRTEKKGFTMKSNPIKLKVDNKHFFDSMGMKSLKELSRDNIMLGKHAVIQAMQKYAHQKKAMTGPGKATIGKIQLMRAQRPIQHMMSFIPKKPSMSWSGGNTEINYEKDITHVSWIPAKVEINYVPYRIKFFIDEWVEVPKDSEE